MQHSVPRGFFDIRVTSQSDESFTKQLTEQLRALIDTRRLAPGETLPATRRLAQLLDISRGTVVTAYDQLTQEGYLESNFGAGTRVNPNLSDTPHGAGAIRTSSGTPQAIPERLAQPLPLTPGITLTDVTGRSAWRKAWQQARNRTVPFSPAEGMPKLRNAIARHLAQTRHSRRSPEDVLVTGGAREGLALILNTLFTRSGRTPVIGVEDPGYPSLRRVADSLGATLVGLPVDSQGLIPEQLPNGLLDAVLVTPSHQYPAGGTLPLDRRINLVQWASQRGVIVIEDDFDAALRYRGEPLPLLSELDDSTRGVVITTASFAASLPATVPLGYLVVPDNLKPQLIATRKALGNPVAPAVQFVITELIVSRELELLLARQRQKLLKRHRFLSNALEQTLSARVQTRAGGINTVFTVAHTPDAQVLLRNMRNALLGPVAESHYWRVRPSSSEVQRFVVGLGGDDDGVFTRAVSRLVNILS